MCHKTLRWILIDGQENKYDIHHPNMYKILTSATHVTVTPWMQSSKSVDLIGHSKFLPW